MRVPTEMWVKALLRRAVAGGAMAVIARHGDDRGGAVFIKMNRLDGTAILLGPAPAGMEGSREERSFVALLHPDGNPEHDVDERMRREAEFDADLWLVEIEDRAGRSFLAD